MAELDYAGVNQYWSKARPSILGPYMMDGFGFSAGAGRFRFHGESRIVSRLIRKLDRGGTALDLGCGIGYWAEYFARYFTKVVAVEASPPLYEAARQRCTPYPNVTAVHGDVLAFEPEDHYELVFLGGMLMYLNESDLISLLRKLVPFLDSGGIILCRETTVRKGTVTLYGDTNLDGSVNFADLSKLLAGYNQAGNWAQGDFDYTGAVAFADLSKMLANYNQSLPASIDIGSYNLDGAAIRALSDAGITVVPEPSTLVLLTSLSALLGFGVVGRRRPIGGSFLRQGFRCLVSREGTMKQFLVLSVCIVLAGAAVANAEVVVTGTRSVYDGSLDKIDFHLAGLTGAEAGLAVNGMEGTWTALGDGAAFYMSSSSLGWKGATALDNSFVEPAPPLSYVNLNGIVSTAFSRTGGGNAYSDFTGTWFTTEPAAYLTPVDPDLGDGLDQTLVGTMYVSTGAGASYVGQFSMSTGYAVAGGCELPPVPEPSTLALLACGLLGLVAYAWRKRK